MHIANINIQAGQDWKNVEDLIKEKISSFTFDNSTYFFTNAGGYTLSFIDTDDLDSTENGMPLQLKEQCGYKKDSGTLYVRSPFGNGELHIEKVEE